MALSPLYRASLNETAEYRFVPSVSHIYYIAHVASLCERLTDNTSANSLSLPPSLIKQYPWLSVPPIAQLIHSSACSSYQLSDAAFLKVVLWGPLLLLCLFFISPPFFPFFFFSSTRFERRFWEDGATFIMDVTCSPRCLGSASHSWLMWRCNRYEVFNLSCRSSEPFHSRHYLWSSDVYSREQTWRGTVKNSK